MKLVLIALGLLATSSAESIGRKNKEPGLAAGLFVCLGRVLINQGTR